jgi:predicted TIM-barrel fold metal-dependent hydrolase
LTIIDAHVHVGSWDHVDFLGRGTSLDETIAVMSESGVAGCAIMPTDRLDNQGLLAEAAARSDRLSLWFFAWVRPDERADLDWVERHRGQVTGLKVHPSLSRVRITDDAFAPALELAASLDLVVVVHCGRWQEMASYRFAIEAAQRHPRVRFLLAHSGGDTPPLASGAARMVLAERVDNVWFDFSGVREYWVIERNVRQLGADRYLLASDYNLAHPLMYIGAVRGMRLTDEERALILGGNALALFGEPLR